MQPITSRKVPSVCVAVWKHIPWQWSVNWHSFKEQRDSVYSDSLPSHPAVCLHLWKMTGHGLFWQFCY